MRIKIVAGLGGNREAGRHRQRETAHLGEACSLAAEQIFHVGAAFGGAVTEPIDPFFHLPAHPSICEKSATRFIVSRMPDSSRSRFSLSAGSSQLTVTLSKKSSMGSRKEANTDVTAKNSSFASGISIRSPTSLRPRAKVVSWGWRSSDQSISPSYGRPSLRSSIPTIDDARR